MNNSFIQSKDEESNDNIRKNSHLSNRTSSVDGFPDKKSNSTNKSDRMILTLDKKKFNWNTNKKIKQKKQMSVLNNLAINLSQKSAEDKFDEYLSDHMSDDSESVQQFLSSNIIKYRQSQKQKRKISQIPFKKTKMFDWRDNFYTNLLDWNHQNLIFTAAGKNLYHFALRSFQNQQCVYDEQLQINNSKINSIKCCPINQSIALAYECGSLRIYDYSRQKTLGVSLMHTLRITALDWSERCILTGSKDKQVSICDERTFKKCIFLKKIHCQQILGIKRSGNLIATGGNDNVVAIYDVRKNNQILDFYQHNAAVKSLAWLEKQKKLISGGGTSDKIIKFWNNCQRTVYKQVQTGSQVCNLVVSKNSSQFISCQGFSQNQVVLWDNEGNRIETFHGQHYSRVLYCALSPSGQYIATGAGDHNLFIWKMFPTKQRRNRLLQISDIR